jgi:hypothetical protein
MGWIILAWCLAAGGQAATLEQAMSEREFRAAGLDRLTPEQLAFLNQYLGREPLPPEKTFGAEHLDATPVTAATEGETIEARILGEFDGWTGHTNFPLDNGQIWQQRVRGEYRHKVVTGVAVEIVRGRFGYYLKVTESGRQIGVTRVK